MYGRKANVVVQLLKKKTSKTHLLKYSCCRKKRQKRICWSTVVAEKNVKNASVEAQLLQKKRQKRICWSTVVAEKNVKHASVEVQLLKKNVKNASVEVQLLKTKIFCRYSWQHGLQYDDSHNLGPFPLTGWCNDYLLSHNITWSGILYRMTPPPPHTIITLYGYKTHFSPPSPPPTPQLQSRLSGTRWLLRPESGSEWHLWVNL
jgi:hypothetical protein